MNQTGKVKTLITTTVAVSVILSICCLGWSMEYRSSCASRFEKLATVNVVISEETLDKDRCILVSRGDSYPPNRAAIMLNISNHMPFQLSAGERFKLQRLTNGAWDDVDPGIEIFNDLLHIIESGSSYTFRCDLPFRKDGYAPGEYRIIKEIDVGKETYSIIFEFMISDSKR